MNEDMFELIEKINSAINQNSNEKISSGNSSISPETISKLLDSFKNSTTSEKEKKTNNIDNSAKDKNSTTNIDIDTIIKLKTLFDKINSENDPRSNLLLALKPYLKESRKQRIEQYIQFFNISKVLDEFGFISGGDIHK